VVDVAALPDTTRASDLYERFSPRIYGYCLHRLGSREEAEDAVQTTFLNAFRGLSRGVVPASESAWLFKIAENVCLSRHRASFRRRRVEAPCGIEAVEETVPAPQGDGDQLIPLEEALAEMPEMQRHALLLREWQGLSYREIATELDVSQSAVETLIFRARRSLARRLEAPRHRLRRVGQAIDVGSVLAALKGALTTGAVVKGTLAAAAVTGLAVGVAVERPQPRRHGAPPPARAQPAKRPVSEATQRADAPLAGAPQAHAAAPAPTKQSRTARPAAAKRSSGKTRPRAQGGAPAPRPAAASPSPPKVVSHPSAAATPPSTPAGSAPPKPGKAQEQQAARGRPADKPAKPEPPKQQADEQQPGPPADPGSQGNQGQGNANGKEK
jgi:RNA polymerase sigma-70 factor, ECF subfamily